MVKSAVVKQSAPSKLPRLLADKLTPEVTCDWNNVCSTYFIYKEVETKNQVKIITFWMLDLCLYT
ncbi:hypothetical protein DFH29DRAFT_810940 [Suillus ampliporus]|nr:hypothetical protein DFH29DRAFT_810940 [Suillus ampliporus]